jgi:hypothetical protein
LRRAGLFIDDCHCGVLLIAPVAWAEVIG